MSNVQSRPVLIMVDRLAFSDGTYEIVYKNNKIPRHEQTLNKIINIYV